MLEVSKSVCHATCDFTHHVYLSMTDDFAPVQHVVCHETAERMTSEMGPYLRNRLARKEVQNMESK